MHKLSANRQERRIKKEGLKRRLTEMLTVPNEAITEAQGLYFVYLKVHPETYLRQEVKLGNTDGSRTEVLEGLKPGDNVVAQGAVQGRLAANATVMPEGHSH